MDSTDLFLTIIIIFIFTFLYIVNIFYIKYFEIKRNWPVYKCQPMIMPFASFFGHDVGDNFVSCISNIQGDLMSEFVGPIMSNLDIISSVGSGLAGDLGSIANMGGNLTSSQDLVFGSFNILLQRFGEVLDSMMTGFSNITNNVTQIAQAMVGVSMQMAMIPTSLGEQPFKWFV